MKPTGPFHRGLSGLLAVIVMSPTHALARAGDDGEVIAYSPEADEDESGRAAEPEHGSDSKPWRGSDVDPELADLGGLDEPAHPTEPSNPADSSQPGRASPLTAAMANAKLTRRVLGLQAEDVPVAAAAAPAGGSKSAATATAIPMPKAEGSTEGMGESFSPVLSTGAATFSLPLRVPSGRAGVQPELTLQYSSTSGNGPVGLGWGVGVPFIARQSDRGMPRYVDAPAWQAEEDRFFFNGGQELVPVDSGVAEFADCGSSGCAPVPAELAGWQQYRARIEEGFLRYFRAPDGRRWVVQSPSGVRMDFGQLPAGDGPPEAVARSTAALQSELAEGSGRIYVWHLTRTTDAHGSTIYYLFDPVQTQRYLADIYYLSPHGACGGLGSPGARMRCAAPLGDYGRRVRFVYEPRVDVTTSFTSGWEITSSQRLRRVEMTSAEASPGQRTLVRRYHFRYDPASYWSLLSSVQLEGRPSRLDGAVGVMVGDPGVAEQSLDDDIVGHVLVPMQLEYTPQPTGSLTSMFAPGLGGLDATVHTSISSPTFSVGVDADLFDVNSDGLPDLVVTDPARFQSPDGDPAVGVLWNGFDGVGTEPTEPGGFSADLPMSVPEGLSPVLRLGNANLSPIDVDGDGRGDYLHLPRSPHTGYFTPVRSGQSSGLPSEQQWSWAYVERELPPVDADPRVDFAHDGARIRVFDVNNDHLVDIVRTTGTAMQVWLNLGWLPGGDGRFGSYERVGNAWQLSTEPKATCLPTAGLPLDFGAPNVRLGDMNGDGVTDIVRVNAGQVVYWPGRGEGAFGVGPADCAPGLAANRHVTMTAPPTQLNAELEHVYLADLNGDGLDDVVQVRTTEVDVWLNYGGQRFASRIRLTGTPFAPAYDPRVRLTDIDGSGTVDILYARSGNWQWIDPLGGERPRLLSRVINGLGGETTMTYGSSVEDYLEDLAAGAACTGAACERFDWSGGTTGCDAKVEASSGECVRRSGGSPVISSVVRQVEISDRLDRLGLPETRKTTRFRYHDAYYEGIEQEFRGFGSAEVHQLGDADQPTAISRSYMHQGRRPEAIASDRLADNPDEALNSAVYLSELFDQNGVHLSTFHTSYTLRHVMIALTGVEIVHARSNQTDVLAYDTGPFVPASATMSLPGVIRPDGSEDHIVRRRGAGYAHMRSTTDLVDGLGNVLQQTAHGRLRGEAGEPVPDERIVSHATYTNVPGSMTGWLWVPSTSFTDGHGESTRLNDTTVDYNASGDAIRTTTVVTQPTFPSFAGDAEAEAFGSPVPEPLLGSDTFDVWGNGLAECSGGDVMAPAACLRRTMVVWDGDYALTTTEEHIGVRTSGSEVVWLSTHATWDRGTTSVVEVVEPNGATTRSYYDGLARLTTMRGPDVAGCTGEKPSARITYFDRTSALSPPISRVLTTAHVSCVDDNQRLETHSYADGQGRTRAVLQTGGAAAGQTWIKAGIYELDRRGSVRRAYQQAFFGGTPTDLAAVLRHPLLTPSARIRRDAFSREKQSFAVDGAESRMVFHALSEDVYDSLDLDSTSFAAGTPVTTRHDGHGRVIDRVVRNRQPQSSSLEFYRLFTTYRADGVIREVRRAQTASDAPRSLTAVIGTREIARTFSHDSAGRRYAATDPNTDGPVAGASWRYLFNRASDLVAVRDPRGCGENYYYDLGGRVIGQTFVGCAEAQQQELAVTTVPAGSVGWTKTTTARVVDARNVYDDYALGWAPNPAIFSDYPSPGVVGGQLGRLVATQDRGVRSVFAYDRRGNQTWEARQLAVIGAASPVPTTLPPTPSVPGPDTLAPAAVVYDAAHTYVRSTFLDHANRGRAKVLPRDPDFAPGVLGPRVVGTLAFDHRGLPFSSTLKLVDGGAISIADGVLSFPGASASETRSVVAGIEYTRDGQPSRIIYGDDVGGTRTPTETVYEYDTRRRVIQAETLRTPTAPLPGQRPLSAVSVLHAQQLSWDAVDNLVGVDDLRIPEEWPDGHRPQFKKIEHDALYRVVGVEYEYAHDGGARTPEDVGSDWRGEQARVRSADPMRGQPAPMAASLPPGRVASLTWQYDWLGNLVDWTDDAHAFFERSLGTISNGSDLAPGNRPSALYLASNLDGTPADRGGWTEVDYGAGGNVVAFTVHARCHDVAPNVCADPGGPVAATRRSTMRARCACASEQQFHYRWDETNRLVDARRYDRSGGTGNYTLSARQRYRYDSDNVRLIKQTLSAGPGDDAPERSTVYVYPGEVERRGLRRGAGTWSVDALLDTETEYLVTGARLVSQAGDPLIGLDADHRLSVAISDHLGSASAVIDLRTGEPTQVSTYYPNGGRETLLGSPTLVPFEPRGFTGKEDDAEVGVVYFGERYLVPGLARWLSPDPAEIHDLAGGELLNAYHYVAGQQLTARDPIGFAPEGGTHEAFKFNPTDARRTPGAGRVADQGIVEMTGIRDKDGTLTHMVVTYDTGLQVSIPIDLVPVQQVSKQERGRFGRTAFKGNTGYVLGPGGLEYPVDLDTGKILFDLTHTPVLIWGRTHIERLRIAGENFEMWAGAANAFAGCIGWSAGLSSMRVTIARATTTPTAKTGRAPAQAPAPARTAVAPATRPSAATKVVNVPEVTAPKAIKPQDAVARWNQFLGPGAHTDTHPRTGLPDPNRIVSADGLRSIRYGQHEMGSSPTKHHYHEETWSYNPATDTMTVTNVQVRVQVAK